MASCLSGVNKVAESRLGGVNDSAETWQVDSVVSIRSLSHDLAVSMIVLRHGKLTQWCQ